MGRGLPLSKTGVFYSYRKMPPDSRCAAPAAGTLTKIIHRHRRHDNYNDHRPFLRGTRYFGENTGRGKHGDSRDVLLRGDLLG